MRFKACSNSCSKHQLQITMERLFGIVGLQEHNHIILPFYNDPLHTLSLKFCSVPRPNRASSVESFVLRASFGPTAVPQLYQPSSRLGSHKGCVLTCSLAHRDGDPFLWLVEHFRCEEGMVFGTGWIQSTSPSRDSWVTCTLESRKIRWVEWIAELETLAV